MDTVDIAESQLLLIDEIFEMIKEYDNIGEDSNDEKKKSFLIDKHKLDIKFRAVEIAERRLQRIEAIESRAELHKIRVALEALMDKLKIQPKGD